jgi:hypothetical protein
MLIVLGLELNLIGLKWFSILPTDLSGCQV